MGELGNELGRVLGELRGYLALPAGDPLALVGGRERGEGRFRLEDGIQFHHHPDRAGAFGLCLQLGQGWDQIRRLAGGRVLGNYRMTGNKHEERDRHRPHQPKPRGPPLEESPPAHQPPYLLATQLHAWGNAATHTDAPF